MRNRLLHGTALLMVMTLSASLAWAQQTDRGGDAGGDSNTTWTTTTRTPQVRRAPSRVICVQLPCRLPDGRVLLGPTSNANVPVIIPDGRRPVGSATGKGSRGSTTTFSQPRRTKKPSSGQPPHREPTAGEILAALPPSRIPIPQPRPDDFGPSLQQAVSGEFEPDEVLVTFDGDAAVAAEIATAFGLEVRSARTSILLGGTLARLGIPDGRPVGVVLAQLATDARLDQAGANHIYDLQTSHTPAQYMFQRVALDADAADGAGIRIAVIDTAVDTSHPALNGVIVDSFDAMPDRPVEKTDHGTSIVGLVAGVGPLKGMAPGSAVYHARAFENDRSNMGILLDALDWAAERDVRIINMSFAGPRNDLFETACKSARARGIVLVAAAGNNGPAAPAAFPGAYDSVVAVTATDKDDALMQQANRGPYVYVSAPGVDVIAPVAGGADFVTGTSIAAAIVSGAIANLLRENPERSPSWIEDALATTARDLGPSGKDTDFGYGLLDMKAVSLMAAQ